MTRIDCRQISGDDSAESEQIRLAYDAVVKDGYVVLDHVVPQQKIAALDGEFRARYHNYLQDSELADTLKIGHRRYMMPLNLSGGFADCLVYANPFVSAVAKLTLGWNAILESFGAVVSLAGAQRQHIHRDGPFLFDAAIAPMLPAHALTFAMPLIDMNDSHGTTALWPASHRWKDRNEDVPPVVPDVPAGSCILWDFRLFHGGTENRSEQHRPMIYGTYSRRWYQDPTNFSKKALPRLSFPEEFLESVPADRRSLFYHLLKTG
jgi:ectoine hydroxylase-related dioxygenase (phytanoyl-CoA dioxygenase family)